MNAEEELLKLKDTEQAKHLSKFFKTGKGQYGEGDIFLGIKVPITRSIVKKYYKTVSEAELQTMLNSPFHEIRLCAILMMVSIYEQTDKKDKVVQLYLQNVKQINNWDLVDLSAYKIIGAEYIRTKNPKIIKQLANSKHLWSERIAIVSQLSILKTGDYTLLNELCEKFLSHKHDLIHKAVGWMLREAGKKDEKVLLNFLDKYYSKMPRTTLRYAIERLTTEQKSYYMHKKS